MHTHAGGISNYRAACVLTNLWISLHVLCVACLLINVFINILACIWISFVMFDYVHELKRVYNFECGFQSYRLPRLARITAFAGKVGKCCFWFWSSVGGLSVHGKGCTAFVKTTHLTVCNDSALFLTVWTVPSSRRRITVNLPKLDRSRTFNFEVTTSTLDSWSFKIVLICTVGMVICTSLHGHD